MTTAIEWTDETWNPTTGCDRTSPGCDNCYALTLAKRLKGMGSAKYQNDGDPRTSGPGFALTMHPDSLAIPLGWRKPRKVFVNSMSDLFHKDVTDEFIARVFAVMALCPQHTFQVLTKRPQRMAALLARPEWWEDVAVATCAFGDASNETIWRIGADGSSTGLPNVWLGTSIESDRYAFRADHLRATPAAVRFISAEPLLGPLPSLDLTGIDWLIAGGESGPRARPMHPDWVRELRDRCMDVTTGTPSQFGTSFLFKQWGAWAPDPSYGTTYSLYDEREVGTLLPFVTTGPSFIRRVEPDQAEWFAAVTDTGHSRRMKRLGKKAAGRELDGRTWDEYPTGSAA